MLYSKIKVAGVDEAGRGPLFGPVYAASVILKPGVKIEGLNDSKKITAKKRELLFDLIISESLAYSIATATVAEIDNLNILHATMLAMQRAVSQLEVSPELVLVDGNRLPKLDYRAEAVIKGDSKHACIAAASILAKVARDREIERLALEYPEYGLAKHKGYPTKLHIEALKKYGPVKGLHRESFRPVKEAFSSI